MESVLSDVNDDKTNDIANKASSDPEPNYKYIERVENLGRIAKQLSMNSDLFSLCNAAWSRRELY